MANQNISDPWALIGEDLPPPSQGLSVEPFTSIGSDLPESPAAPPVQPPKSATGDPFAGIGADLPDAPVEASAGSGAPVPQGGTTMSQALTSGLATAIQQGVQSAQVAAGLEPTNFGQEVPKDFQQDFHWGDVLDPSLLLRKAAYQTGASAPSLAAGLGGGAVASAAAGGPETPVGVTAGIAGGALAAGIVQGAQTLGPYYAAELKKSPLDPDAAFDRAAQMALNEGALTGVSWAAFVLGPFKGPMKNLMLQAFAIQPTIMAAGKSAMEQKPFLETLGEVAPGAALMTAGPAAAIHGAQVVAPLLGKRGKGLDIEPAGEDQAILSEPFLNDVAKQYVEDQRQKDLIAEETIAGLSTEAMDALARSQPGHPDYDFNDPLSQKPWNTEAGRAMTAEEVEAAFPRTPAPQPDLMRTLAELPEPTRVQGVETTPDLEAIPEPANQNRGAPVTEAEKYQAAVEKQKAEGPLSLGRPPDTIGNRKKALGLEVIEGGKKERTPKPKLDVVPPENRPRNLELHKKAFEIGKAFLEIGERLGLKAPLEMHFVDSIRDRDGNPVPDALGEHVATDSGRTKFTANDLEGRINVAVDKHSRVAELWTTISHEFGHHVVAEKLRDAPQHVRQAVLAAYKNWRRSTRPSDLMRAKILSRTNALSNYYTAHGFGGMEVRSLPPAERRYWFGLEEFLAEQVAKWATTDARPKTVGDKWLKGTAKLLTSLYSEARRRFTSDPELAPHFQGEVVPELGEWLNSLFDRGSFAREAYESLRAQTRAEAAIALRRAGENPELAVPRETETQPLIDMVQKLFGRGQVPPRVEATAAHVDKINGFMKLVLSLQQIAKMNKDMPHLQLYREDTAASKLERDRIMAEANPIVQEWRKLGEADQEALVGFVDDLMQMAYRSPEEARQGVRRQPTAEEFQALAREHGMNDRTLRQWQRISQFFGKQLERIEELMIRDTRKITNDVERAKAIESVGRQIRAMRAAPYFPAMRFGNHTLQVLDGAGRQTAFYTFRTQKEALAAREKIERESDSGEKGYVGLLKEEARPFLGMPPALLDKISEKMNLSEAQKDALNKLRFELAPAQSFRHRLQPKKMVKGYSTDFRRAFANYAFHFANHYSRVKYHDLLEGHIKNTFDDTRNLADPRDRTRRQEVANFMNEHFREMMDPRSDYAKLRALTAHWYLGFSPATAAQNLSQTPLFTYPFLASKFGDARAIGAILDAGRDVSTYYKKGTLEAATAGELKAMGELVRDGIITEAQAPELAAMSEGENLIPNWVGSKVADKIQSIADKSMLLFSLSEQMNRRVAARAAYRLALREPQNRYVREAVQENQRHYQRLLSEGWQPSEAAAVVTAADAVRSTQFEYNRESLPKMFWGKKRTLFAFQTFKQNALFFLYNYPQAAVRSLLLMGFLGGAMNLPGTEDLQRILKAIGFLFFGKDWDLEREARKFVVDLLGENEDAPGYADIALHGLGRYGYGIPAIMDSLGGTVGVNIPAPSFDRSRALGIGPILPVDVSELFGPEGAVDAGHAFSSVAKGGLGAAFSIPMMMWQALNGVQSGQGVQKSLEKGVPKFIASLSKAYRYATQGKETLGDGSTLVSFDPHDPQDMAEILGVALGYTPTRVSQGWDAVIAQRELAAYWDLRRQMLFKQADVAWQSGDAEQKSRIIAAIKEFNKGLPADLKGKAISNDGLKASLRNRATVRKKRELGIPLSKSDIGISEEIAKLYPGAISVKKVH